MKRWLEIQRILESSLPAGSYKVWIAPLIGRMEDGDDGCRLRLTAPTDFAAETIRARFLDAIEAAAAPLLEAPLTVLIEAAAPKKPVSETAAPAQTGAPRPAAAPARPRALPAESPQPAVADFDQLGLPLFHASPEATPLHPRYSFDNYVVGGSNQLAFAAARSICDADLSMDCLFLASGPGLGKTHLAQAMGNALCRQSNRSTCRVEYMGAEEFGARFVAALKAREIESFKARYGTADLLLLEDVHFLQGKEKMQDELLSIVKALQAKGARVVFSSSFAPRDLKDMDSQLASRFCSGVVAVIDAPDFETRKRILKNKASHHQVTLPEDVTELLADRIKTDVRQIESCIKGLALKARLLKENITMGMAWEMLSQYAQPMAMLDLDGIIRSVSQACGVSADQMLSRSHKQQYVMARNAVFYLARKHTELTLKEIGRRMNRTHATVIKGISSLEREIARETPKGRQISATLSLVEKTSRAPSLS